MEMIIYYEGKEIGTRRVNSKHPEAKEALKNNPKIIQFNKS